MQYILDENEMKSFQTDREALREILKTLPSTKTLQTMCTKIANEWPTFTGWDNKNPSEPRPWRCVITEEEDGNEWYCDKCPVQNICPYPHKEWSK